MKDDATINEYFLVFLNIDYTFTITVSKFQNFPLPVQTNIEINPSSTFISCIHCTKYCRKCYKVRNTKTSEIILDREFQATIEQI